MKPTRVNDFTPYYLLGARSNQFREPRDDKRLLT